MAKESKRNERTMLASGVGRTQILQSNWKKIIHIAQRQWFSEINNNSTYKLHKESKRERERKKGDKIWKMKETQREPFLEFRSFVDRPYYTDVCMRKIERKATIMPKNGVWLETTQRRRESKRYMKI